MQNYEFILNMKFKKNKIIKTYYIFLLALVVTQAISTVFGLSQTIYYQKQLNRLESKHRSLLIESIKLEKELSQELSLSSNTQTATKEFESIQKPLVIKADHRVALR